jgi:hypothetical protein
VMFAASTSGSKVSSASTAPRISFVFPTCIHPFPWRMRRRTAAH